MNLNSHPAQGYIHIAGGLSIHSGGGGNPLPHKRFRVHSNLVGGTGPPSVPLVWVGGAWDTSSPNAVWICRNRYHLSVATGWPNGGPAMAGPPQKTVVGGSIPSHAVRACGNLLTESQSLPTTLTVSLSVTQSVDSVSRTHATAMATPSLSGTQSQPTPASSKSVPTPTQSVLLSDSRGLSNEASATTTLPITQTQTFTGHNTASPTANASVFMPNPLRDTRTRSESKEVSPSQSDAGLTLTQSLHSTLGGGSRQPN